MTELVRTGVSIEQDLLDKFDELIARRGYGNRSEALRDLIRDTLVTEEVSENKPVVATVSMIYDHHRPELSNKLTEAQHHHHDCVLAATHVHLDEKNCFEVVIMKRPGGRCTASGRPHAQFERSQARQTRNDFHRQGFLTIGKLVKWELEFFLLVLGKLIVKKFDESIPIQSVRRAGDLNPAFLPKNPREQRHRCSASPIARSCVP